MAAGGLVMNTKEYWLWQAESCFYWYGHKPRMRWETHMYLCLFKWCGYEDE